MEDAVKGVRPSVLFILGIPFLVAMRELAKECMLTEEVKWSVPCYTLNGKNVLMIHAFKEYCSIMFMKGALLTDPENILHRQTEHVTAGRQLRYTTLEGFMEQRELAKAFILEAIALEKGGAKVPTRTQEDPVVDELKEAFSQDKAFKTAFYQLTPRKATRVFIAFCATKTVGNTGFTH